MKKFKKFLPALFVFTFIFVFQCFINTDVVLAESWLDRQLGIGESGSREIGCAFGECTAEPTDVREIVVSILNVLFTFLGLIMVLLIMYAGYLWMTAGGKDDQVETAKKYLRNAIIGIVIILASYSITTFVSWSIVNPNG